jgi:hypothetical protein
MGKKVADEMAADKDGLGTAIPDKEEATPVIYPPSPLAENSRYLSTGWNNEENARLARTRGD